LNVTIKEFDRVFNINVKSIFQSVQATIPVLKKFGGGSIINLSSISSIRPRAGKWAQHSMNV
jgi:3-oxoacyl-[acyl-carrier protein] reductase